MVLDDRQIIAKLQVARGLIREVKMSLQDSSVESVRCYGLVTDITNLIDSILEQ